MPDLRPAESKTSPQQYGLPKICNGCLYLDENYYCGVWKVVDKADRISDEEVDKIWDKTNCYGKGKAVNRYLCEGCGLAVEILNGKCSNCNAPLDAGESP